MPKPRVLCVMDLDLAPNALDALREVADVDCRPPRPSAFRDIERYDAYVGGAELPLTAAIIARASRLRVVATPSTGTDHIDTEALARRGIPLLSLTREYALLDSFTATAEHAWGLLLACMRRTPAALENVRRGRWPRARGFVSWQLSGKTLGVVGVGRLGKMVVEYGKAFRMRVLGCDPRPFRIAGVKRAGFDELLRESDVISLHVHLTDQTRGMISRAAFARMKRGAVLVNTSRGGLIDERAFVSALESGRLGAAGVDVIDGEWSRDLKSHPLVRYARRHDNLVITPHIASATVESIAGGRIHIANLLARHLQKPST